MAAPARPFAAPFAPGAGGLGLDTGAELLEAELLSAAVFVEYDLPFHMKVLPGPLAFRASAKALPKLFIGGSGFIWLEFGWWGGCFVNRFLCAWSLSRLVCGRRVG